MSGYQPWKGPEPTTEVGLKSDTVFGQNLGVTAGIYHTLTLGSRVQVTVNPFALTELGMTETAALMNVFGAGGMGGNLQMIVGTDAKINWGTQYKINLMGEEIKFDPSTSVKSLPNILCAIICAVCIVYTITYSACRDEDPRAGLAIAFQVTLDILLALLIAYLFGAQTAAAKKYEAYTDFYLATYSLAMKKGESAERELKFKSIPVIVGVLGALVAPVVGAAVAEAHFSDDQ